MAPHKLYVVVFVRVCEQPTASHKTNSTDASYKIQ